MERAFDYYVEEGEVAMAVAVAEYPLRPGRGHRLRNPPGSGKTGVSNRAEAATYASRQGLVS